VTLTTALVSIEKIYGFRLQKQIQRLAMASALKNGRERVTPEDVELIQELSNYINLNYNQI
jgi:DNA replication initiation complex subunit (GINS family)